MCKSVELNKESILKELKEEFSSWYLQGNCDVQEIMYQMMYDLKLGYDANLHYQIKLVLLDALYNTLFIEFSTYDDDDDYDYNEVKKLWYSYVKTLNEDNVDNEFAELIVKCAHEIAEPYYRKLSVIYL